MKFRWFWAQSLTLLVILGWFTLILLFVLGSLIDNKIAQAFQPFNPNNFFGAWGDVWASATFTIPLWIIAILILHQWRIQANNPLELWKLNLILVCIGLVFLVVIAAPMFKGASATRWLAWSFGLTIYLLTYGFCYWYFTKPNQIEKLKTGQYKLQTFLTIILYMIALYFSVGILKLIFQRPRMLSPYPYQGWWAIDWSNFSITDNSFPSGHTATVMGLLPLLLLLKPKTRRYFIFGVTFWILIGLIALSRMVYCQHYLTDVIASMIIGGGYWYVAKIVNRQDWLSPWELKIETNLEEFEQDYNLRELEE